jgi:hypothetical protein
MISQLLLRFSFHQRKHLLETSHRVLLSAVLAVSWAVGRAVALATGEPEVSFEALLAAITAFVSHNLRIKRIDKVPLDNEPVSVLHRVMILALDYFLLASFNLLGRPLYFVQLATVFIAV